MFYQWMAVTLAYYGLTFSSTDLAGDPYSNFCSSVAIEIPGRFILAIYEKLTEALFLASINADKQNTSFL